MFISYLYYVSYREDIMFQFFLIICFVYEQLAAISKKKKLGSMIFWLPYLEKEPLYFKNPGEMLAF